jgi:RimJ/RimL family protein N-acetyltransferase
MALVALQPNEGIPDAGPGVERLGPTLWRIIDRAGRAYALRPISVEDAPALQRAFAAQDPEDRRMRLRVSMPKLSDRMARRFCTCDATRDLVYVLVPEVAPNTLAGGARVMRDHTGSGGEFAVTMASTLKGMGLGRAVLATVLGAAAEAGITHVWGTVDRRNHGMRQLAAKLGMTERRDPDDRSSVLTELVLIP